MRKARGKVTTTNSRSTKSKAPTVPEKHVTLSDWHTLKAHLNTTIANKFQPTPKIRYSVICSSCKNDVEVLGIHRADYKRGKDSRWSGLEVLPCGHLFCKECWDKLKGDNQHDKLRGENKDSKVGGHRLESRLYLDYDQDMDEDVDDEYNHVSSLADANPVRTNITVATTTIIADTDNSDQASPLTPTCPECNLDLRFPPCGHDIPVGHYPPYCDCHDEGYHNLFAPRKPIKRPGGRQIYRKDSTPPQNKPCYLRCKQTIQAIEAIGKTIPEYVGGREEWKGQSWCLKCVWEEEKANTWPDWSTLRFKNKEEIWDKFQSEQLRFHSGSWGFDPKFEPFTDEEHEAGQNEEEEELEAELDSEEDDEEEVEEEEEEEVEDSEEESDDSVMATAEKDAEEDYQSLPTRLITFHIGQPNRLQSTTLPPRQPPIQRYTDGSDAMDIDEK